MARPRFPSCFLQHILGRLVEVKSCKPQLLVDVSVLWRHDAGTGIQRVVRALSEQLLQSDLGGYDLAFVGATRRRSYRYLERTCPGGALTEAGRISVRPGDIFLGLDLSSRILPRHHRQVRAWRRKGAWIAIIVYDLLPAQNPEWFNDRQAQYFKKWLWFICRYADQALCISQAVAQDLRQWSQEEGRNRIGKPLEIESFPLGSDLRQSRPSQGISVAQAAMLEKLQGKAFILMVGTIEPRKGHMVALEALDLLHDQNADAPAFVIVGRPGWKSEDVQDNIRRHRNRDGLIFWFDDASDELLDKIYDQCVGVLFPSFAEGFGLPIVEALAYSKPVLIRDIAVFKEISSPLITYFRDDSAAALAQSISDWLDRFKNNKTLRQNNLPTWQRSCATLLHHLKVSA